MLQHDFFFKRFSVGLTLDTTLEEFVEFLRKYHPYIANIYFSLPMGDKFHSRSNVRIQFRDPRKVILFWSMLEEIKKYDIKLELVLNNGNVTKTEVETAQKMLIDHNINVDVVGITNDIYLEVKSVFCSQDIVYSFNNRTNTIDEYKRIPYHYDQIVVGRRNIRNFQLFSFIHNVLNSKVVLLLNNGCSHYCPGCTTLANCHAAYYRSKTIRSSEFLYALQSIMPYEIHEGYLKTEHIDLFKVNSRNASILQLSSCMDSYINCIEEKYINESIGNYMLWGRLAWHEEYYHQFSIDRIRNYKSAIYNGEVITADNNPIHFCVDYRDRVTSHEKPHLDKETANEWVSKRMRGVPFIIDDCILGISNCRKLLYGLSIQVLVDDLLILRQQYKRIYYELPALLDTDYTLVDELFALICSNSYGVDCIIVNDWQTFHYLRNRYSIAIALGEQICNGEISSPINDYMIDNDQKFGSVLISEKLKAELKAEVIHTIVFDAKPGGVCISVDEKLKMLINLCHRTIKFHACPFVSDNTACNKPCLSRNMNNYGQMKANEPFFQYFNSIREPFYNYHRLEKTVLENRATFILNCEE